MIRMVSRRIVEISKMADSMAVKICKCCKRTFKVRYSLPSCSEISHKTLQEKSNNHLKKKMIRILIKILKIEVNGCIKKKNNSIEK